MDVINNKLFKSKKGFVFVFLAFFFSLIIFAIAHLNISQEDLAKDAVFKDARISSIDNELKYLKNTYIPNALAYSLYNTLYELMNYTKTNPAVYQQINKNYPRFNELMLEGMLNGSFNGVVRPNLISPPNKTLSFFIESYQKIFQENYYGNFSFNITGINVYEDKPYYIKVQLLGNFTVKTYENISKWNSIEIIEASIPIFDLYDPTFYFYTDQKIPIMPSEFNLYDANLTIDSFKKIVDESYTTIYYEPKHKYTIGTSFINRFLNITTAKSYHKVLGMWSFDYDELEEKVFDSSDYNSSNSKHFGNTRLSLNFHPSLVNYTTNIAYDKTSYQNNATIYGADCISQAGVRNVGCKLDGTDDYLEISNPSSLQLESNFSLSIWIKPDLSNLDDFELIKMSDGSNNGFELGYQNSTNKFYFKVGDGSILDTLYSNSVSLTNNWMHILAVFDNRNMSDPYLRIYHNGLLVGLKETTIDQVQYLLNDLEIGGDTNFFKGLIDEINIYSKVLNTEEMARVYVQKEVVNIDYVDSYLGEGINFDGVDDYIEIEQDMFQQPLSQVTVEFWIKTSYINYSGESIFNVAFSSGDDNLLMFTLYNNTNYKFYSYHDIIDEDILSIDYEFEKNKYYHIVNVFDGSSKKVYINGRFINDTSVSQSLQTSSRNIILGADDGGAIGMHRFFNGLIDEVKIYNKTLYGGEIRSNYHNYPANSKGCCNYLMMVSPEKFGYNNIAYAKNISYSSTLFYDYHIHTNIAPNIALYNFSTITSTDINIPYYNLLFDQCTMEAYQMFSNAADPLFDYGVKRDPIISDDKGSCSNLVKLGIY